MKKYLLLAFIIAAGCSEDEDQTPIQPDLFIGSWNYIDSYADIDLAVDFSVVKNGDDYTINSIKLQYSEIPTNETLNYKVELRDAYAAGDGFGMIRVIAGWTTTCPNGLVCDKWIFIDFNNTKIYKKGGSTKYIMSAQTVTVLMINKDELILKDQELIKAN